MNDLRRHIPSPKVRANSLSRQYTTILFSKIIRAQFCEDRLTFIRCRSFGSVSYTNFNASESSSTPPKLRSDRIHWLRMLPSACVEQLTLLMPETDHRCLEQPRRGDVRMTAGLIAIGPAAVGMNDSSGNDFFFLISAS